MRERAALDKAAEGLAEARRSVRDMVLAVVRVEARTAAEATAAKAVNQLEVRVH